MRTIKKITILASVFLFGCGFYGGPSKLIRQYKKAKEEKDCRRLQELSLNKKFPLKDLARVRRYRFCLTDSDPSFNWKIFAPYLQKEALKASYHRFSKNENIKEFAKVSRELSRISRDYNEKVRYLKRAMHSAKGAGLNLLAKQIQGELFTLSPSLNPREKNLLAAAHDYKKRKLYNRSIKSFRKVLNSGSSPPLVRQECFLNLQKLYRLTRNRRKQITAASQYSLFLKRNKGRIPIHKGYFESRIQTAKNYWNNHQTAQALSHLKKLEAEYGSEAPLDQIDWLRGKIFEEKEEHHKALFQFDKAKQRVKNKNSEFYEKLVWDLVWNLRKLKFYPDAIGHLMEFEKQKKEALSSKFIFWKAHILEEMGLVEQARRFYEQLIEEVPFDFHGLMAHYKMDHPVFLDLKQTSFKNNPYQLMGHLLAANEKDLALIFMEQKMKEQKKKSPPASKEEMFQLFSYAAKAGVYLPFFQYAGGMKPPEKSLFMRHYAHELFPKIYISYVDKASHLFDTPTSIIYAIMRQESAFNKKALSPMGAVGLMQVLPRLARSVAKKEGISYRRWNDLYDPETNILIGASHLSHIFKKWGQHLILNSAIYNAGQKPVKKWMERFSMENPIEFIQNIPYSETRTYVRLIIRNYVFYELLKDGNHKMDFPKHILSLPPNP